MEVADADGRIGEEEYKDAPAHGMLETEESFDAAYAPFLKALLEIVDGDPNGPGGWLLGDLDR